ncbi:MAG: UPF0262 family protein [Alphaproteobacteria bacterium]|nr:MAG: UPF0262 family protein [Alphaproteobacteria bacterium]
MADSEQNKPVGHDKSKSRLIDILLDEQTLVHTNADIEHERKVAIFDLLQDNYFAPVGAPIGPYVLRLSTAENRLLFDIRQENHRAVGQVVLSLSPFRRLVKDYLLMCESYYDAIRRASPIQIETIDMGRRALHNEGSQLLIERLNGKVETDFDTARRLFTLLCVLHIRG